MKFLKKLKHLNIKRRFQIEVIVSSSVVLIVVVVLLVTHLKTSYASGFTYSYLGESVWNPKLTQYYQDSDFYSYACQNPGSTSSTADVVVAMVASSYETNMQAGSYEPSASIEINGSKIINLGASWNFNGVFATGTSVNHSGAWLRAINTLVNLPVTDTISMGPLATSYWPSVQTNPIAIGNLSDCEPPATPPPSTPLIPTNSSSSSSSGATSSSSSSSSSSTIKSTSSSSTSTSTSTSKTITVPSNSTTTKQTSTSSTQKTQSQSASSPSATVKVNQSLPSSQVVPNPQSASGISFLDQSIWYWPTTGVGLNSLETAVSPISNGSPNGYLFGSRFSFTQASSSFTGFLGLETLGQNPAGEAAIFSITGASSSSGPGVNTSGSSSGLSYRSSEISFNWQDNQSYQLEVKLTSQTATTNTWTATVSSYSSPGSPVTIGSIVTPSNLGLIYGQTETFTDRYSGVNQACSDISPAEVEFSNITSDSGSVIPVTHFSLPPDQTGCNGNYETEDMPGQVIQIVW